MNTELKDRKHEIQHMSIKSIKTLMKTQWLDDEIIDYIIRRTVSQTIEAKDTKIMKGVFFQQLISKPNTMSLHRSIMRTVINNYKREKIMNKKYIIIPICYKNHWKVCIIVNSGQENNINSGIKNIHCIFMDSMNKKQDEKIRDIIRIYIRYRLAYENQKYTTINMIERNPNVPKQKDDYNCGIFVIHYIEKLYENIEDNIRKILECTYDFAGEWVFNPYAKRIQLIMMLHNLNMNNILKIHLT